MFTKNVFINCPFDEKYVPLLRPMIFTVISLGFTPQIASQRFNSAEQRIHKICELIQISKFSIHDISRIKSSKKGELSRLNMPLELGIDLGCKLFKGGETENKVFLIIEKERYDFHKALSDMAGVDIKGHGDDPEQMVLHVRNWFVENGLKKAPSPTKIWGNFNDFMADFYQKRQQDGFSAKDLQMMPIQEYNNFIKHWIDQRIK